MGRTVAAQMGPRGRADGEKRGPGFGMSSGRMEGPFGELEPPGGEAGVERENS